MNLNCGLRNLKSKSVIFHEIKSKKPCLLMNHEKSHDDVKSDEEVVVGSHFGPESKGVPPLLNPL